MMLIVVAFVLIAVGLLTMAFAKKPEIKPEDREPVYIDAEYAPLDSRDKNRKKY